MEHIKVVTLHIQPATVIQFILNDQSVITHDSPGLTVLDFIRYNKNLTGTKIGCREGDCGACTILAGEIINDSINYRSVTSCLMPLANAHGKHIVTIEGINMKDLNAVQQAMSDEAATQCGFCTPGFVMSLTGFCLQKKYTDAVAAVDGNICRCTGYKSIERAARRIAGLMTNIGNSDPILFSIDNQIVPEYFSTIQKRLIALNAGSNELGVESPEVKGYFVAGGTDLYVQKHEEMAKASSRYISCIPAMKEIYLDGKDCVIGASATVTDLIESSVIRKIFPDFLTYTKLISSTPIRNMATIGGNLVNASPIGDFTVIFLALNARIILTNDTGSREILLRNFYRGYKKIDKEEDEYIKEIRFPIPQNKMLFSFEKISKRTNLDIASVNSAICIIMNDGIPEVSISAGGVGPIPMYLKKTSAFLSGNAADEDKILNACRIALDEISPISDVRGSAEYKQKLLYQFIIAHFITLFPEELQPEKLLRNEKY